MPIFENNVEKTLTARGWSKQLIADRSGLQRSHLSRIVSGKHSPSIATAYQIADALGVSLSELVREDYDPLKKKKPRVK